MASLHRQRNARGKESPFWAVKFRDGTGRIVNRSTKQRSLREAQRVALAWEDAAIKARRRELTNAASVKILRDLMAAIPDGELLSTPSIVQCFDGYLDACKAQGAAAGTIARYKPVFRRLVERLGKVRAAASVASLGVGDLESWRNAELAAGMSARSCNMSVSIIRAALNRAKRNSEVLSNVAEAVVKLPERSDEREPFSNADIAKLMKAAKGDWRGVILLAARTGLRLVDAASLTWGSLDLEEGTMSMTPAKTGKTLKVALVPELLEYLRAQAPGVGKAPVFPTLAGRISGSNGGLSNEFARLMKKAQVVAPAGREKEGRGRQVRTKSFHSLRHTFVSTMANSDIPADLRKEFAGHDTDEVHHRYVHFTLDKQREALAKLPCLGGWK